MHLPDRILGITDDTSFVDFLVSDANVGGLRKIPFWNIQITLEKSVAVPGNLTSLLRRVVFVGEAPFCLNFNFSGHVRTAEPVKSARQRAAASAWSMDASRGESQARSPLGEWYDTA
jgi:hypothetical protein